MNKKDLLSFALLTTLYLITLVIRAPQVFSYRFNPQVVTTYMHSQDITHEVTGRVFISDSDGGNALGYIYIHGGDPTWYNFQHGPFIKYLYGFSTLIFGNGYIAQLLLGLLLIYMTYLFGKRWKSSSVGIIAATLLLLDPLFTSLSSQFLLDLGQSALLLLYLYLVLFHRKSYLSQGMVFGVLCASKFWAPPLFFFLIIHFFLLIKKQLSFKTLVLQLSTAAITFTLVYMRSFIVAKGVFNIIFFELKTLKFWLTQSVSSTYGATFVLFMSGYFKTWWGDQGLSRATVWSPLWPVLFLATTWQLLGTIRMKKLHWTTLFLGIPVLYFLYIGIQAPFERYFIVILPFLYLSMGSMLSDYFDRY